MPEEEVVEVPVMDEPSATGSDPVDPPVAEVATEAAPAASPEADAAVLVDVDSHEQRKSDAQHCSAVNAHAKRIRKYGR